MEQTQSDSGSGLNIEEALCREMSRRRFLKVAGYSAAAVGVAGVVGGQLFSPGIAAAQATTLSQTAGKSYIGKEDLADQAAAKGKKTIGYVTLCAVCAGTARIVKFAEAEAARRGWTFQVADTGADISKAPGLFETFIQSKVDFLGNSAIDPTSLGDVVSKATAANIPMFIESAPWAPGFAFSVNQDTFDIAQKQAAWIASRLGGKGNVGILTYSPVQVVAEREQLLRAILGQYPDIKIVETHTVDQAKAIDDCRQTVDAWLVKYPKGQLGAVWGGWDDPAVGAATAIDAAGRKEIFVIGNDCGPDVIELMRSGSSFDGDLWVDGQAIAAEMFHQLDLITLGQKVESREFYPVQPILSPILNNLPEKGKDPAPCGTYFIWPNS
jgi:ribose transport system substrate-binding protein